jgi:ring-1,2-phenylacetyl-CoA epoxidase subunit PaaD
VVSTTTPVPTVDRVREVLATVVDPEIPVITIADLGILREVSVGPARTVVVTITPTYSGCPAMEEIRADIRTALARHGWDEVEVRTVLSPAWTTDWMTEQGRRRLREFGIAPPTRRAAGPVPVQLGRRVDAELQSAELPSYVVEPVACPQCGSADTEELTRFASTSCKALWRCRECREPFDHFKDH